MLCSRGDRQGEEGEEKEKREERANQMTDTGVCRAQQDLLWEAFSPHPSFVPLETWCYTGTTAALGDGLSEF